METASDPHLRAPHGKNVIPVVQMDMLFESAAGDEALAPGLCLADKDSGCPGVCAIPSKQPDYPPFVIVQFLKFLSYVRLILHYDQEGGLIKMAEKAKAVMAKEHGVGVMLEKGPKYSHQSQGTVEGGNKIAEGQIRVLGTHRMLPWVMRHSGFLVTKFNVKDTGHAAWYYIRGKEYAGELCELGENILYKIAGMTGNKLALRWERGLWLGKDFESDGHLVGRGTTLVKARTIRRLPEGERWALDLYKDFELKPWGTKGQVIESGPGSRKRYITAAEIFKHGKTAGCGGCSKTSATHSERCRNRFEKIWAKEPKP